MTQADNNEALWLSTQRIAKIKLTGSISETRLALKLKIKAKGWLSAYLMSEPCQVFKNKQLIVRSNTQVLVSRNRYVPSRS